MEDANKYNLFDIIGSIIAIIILVISLCSLSSDKKPVKYYPDPYEDIDAYK
jgi:hypothetical protein